MKNIIWFLPLLGCVVIAGLLAWYEKDGWGWFLFVAFLLTPSFSSTKDED